MVCRLSAEPPLPPALLEALERQLEAGREAEFLDSLCLAAPQAAELCRLLTPPALQAAGLLPGGAVLGPAPGYGGARPVLRLSLRAQQAHRALHLQCEFVRGGVTLLQLVTPRTTRFAGWAVAAWGEACRLRGCHAAPDGTAGYVQAKQAWCSAAALRDVVAVLLRAVAQGGGPGGQP